MTLLQLIEKTIAEICLDPNFSAIYSKLVYNSDYLEMIGNTRRTKQNLQQLSLNWTGDDEERFPSLKLLRMKAFGTI